MLALAVPSSDQPPPHTVSGVGAIPTEETFGEVDVGRVLTLSTFVTGYTEALERFRAAVRDPKPPEETFKPLFEALSWAFSIDDYWLREKRPALRQPLIFAIRFARNRAVHGWADILHVSEAPAAGISVTLASGGRRGGALASGHLVRHWRWRDFDELPRADPDKRQGEKQYQRLLSTELVQPTLDDLEAIFNNL
jgi:hypothetical protein